MPLAKLVPVLAQSVQLKICDPRVLFAVALGLARIVRAIPVTTPDEVVYLLEARIRVAQLTHTAKNLISSALASYLFSAVSMKMNGVGSYDPIRHDGDAATVRRDGIFLHEAFWEPRRDPLDFDPEDFL